MGTCFPEHPSPRIPPRTASGRLCQENGGPFLDGKGDVGLNLVLGTPPCLVFPHPRVSLSLSPSLNAVLRMQLCCCWQSTMTPGCSDRGGTAGVEQPRS